MTRPNTDGKVKELRESVAETVRMARAKRRMSQIEVAEAAGTSPMRVQEMEKGNADYRLSTLARIAGVLGIEVSVKIDAA